MDCCGNCQAPFKDKSTKIKQIFPRCDEGDEGVLIYQALSIIFEVAPLTPNDVGGGEQGVITKRDVFRKGSLFTFGERAGSFAICVNCSEVLTDLYSCFQQFTKVCKLKSEVGRILKQLEKGGEGETSSYKGRDDDPLGNERVSGSEKSRLEIFNVTVKTEREEEERSGDEGDDYFDGGGNSPSSHGVNDDGGIDIDHGIAIKAPPDSDDDYYEENQNDQENTNKQFVRRKSERSRRKTEKMVLGDSIALEGSDSDTNRPIHQNSESDDDYVPPIKQKENLKGPIFTPSPKTSFPKGIISQYQCPHCPKQFLHLNTLLCHRRIVHRDPIKILPPNPRPQVPLNPTSNLSHSQALASSNGQTSSCPICRQDIPRTEIRLHLSNHTRSQSKPWLCTICGVNCSSQRDLHHHSRTHVQGIPCQRCFKKIPTFDMLNHIRRCAFNQLEDELRCKICRKKFQTHQLLDLHTIKVHAQSWRCKLCGIKFTQREKMQQHMLAHKQKKSNKCKICDKLFDRLDVLRLHVKRFHRNNDNPSTSSVPPTSEHGGSVGGAGDDDSFGGDDFPEAPNSPVEPEAPPKSKYTKKKESKAASSSFVAALSKDNRFACSGCDFQCPTASKLDNHLVEIHTDKETRTCKICDRQMQDSYCLELHVKTHGEIKPFECFDEACGKIYRDKSSFFYHLKEKHGMDGKQIIGKYSNVYRKMDKDYSIRYIKKKYAQQKSGNPKNEGGKFPCEFCGKVFPKVYAVRNHIKIVHEKVKDYLCKYCGKAFARKSYFMVHERLHTSNESPYKCHLCDKAFRLPGNLKMHLKSTIHSASRDHVCDICGKGFNRKDNLTLHVKTVHMKIAVRKPRGEKSDRYTHGGRNRIYVVNPNENEESNVAAEEPVAGTSQSFYLQSHPPEQIPTHASSSSSSGGLSMPVLQGQQDGGQNNQQQMSFLEGGSGYSYR